MKIFYGIRHEGGGRGGSRVPLMFLQICLFFVKTIENHSLTVKTCFANSLGFLSCEVTRNMAEYTIVQFKIDLRNMKLATSNELRTCKQTILNVSFPKRVHYCKIKGIMVFAKSPTGCFLFGRPKRRQFFYPRLLTN